MQFVAFEKSHAEDIARWLFARGKCAEALVAELPHIGFVAVGARPVACAFLRRCEGKIFIIEGLATDPEASPRERHDGIKGLIELCLSTAKELGARRIIAWSKEPSVLVRGLGHGFSLTGDYLIFREV